MGHSIIYWTVAAILIVKAQCSGCAPAVVGSTYSLCGEFHHDFQCPLEVLWRRGWTPASSCRSSMACYDYSDVTTVTTMTSLGAGLYTFNLTLKNVSKQDTGVWVLRYLGLASLHNPDDIYSCKLKVFDMSVLELQLCPEFVNEGSEVSCLCKSKEYPDGNITIDWVDDKGNLQNNGEQKLTFTATRNSSGFVCLGRTSAGLENTPLYYKPLITGESQDKPTYHEVNLTSKKYFLFAFSVVKFLLIITVIFLVTKLLVYFKRNNCQVMRNMWSKCRSICKNQHQGLLLISQLNETFQLYDETQSTAVGSTHPRGSRPTSSKEISSELGKQQTVDFKLKQSGSYIESSRMLSAPTLQSQLTLENQLAEIINDLKLITD